MNGEELRDAMMRMAMKYRTENITGITKNWHREENEMIKALRDRPGEMVRALQNSMDDIGRLRKALEENIRLKEETARLERKSERKKEVLKISSEDDIDIIKTN